MHTERSTRGNSGRPPRADERPLQHSPGTTPVGVNHADPAAALQTPNPDRCRRLASPANYCPAGQIQPYSRRAPHYKKKSEEPKKHLR
jgi:hypothetical protein